MRKILHSLVIVLLCMLPNLFFGQQTTTVGQQTTSSLSTGVPGACGNTVGPNFISSTASAGNPSVQNGTNVIGNIYSNTMCGLDFTQASQRLGKRFTPQGINQP